MLNSVKTLWYFESLWLPPCKKKSYKYLELKLTEEHWILISPLDPEGFLFESVFQHFCMLLDQIFQALGAQLTCNLHTWLVGINNDTAKMNPDLAGLCNWKTIQLWNCLDYFKTAKNCAQLCYFTTYRSGASPTGMPLINLFSICLIVSLSLRMRICVQYFINSRCTDDPTSA